MDKLEPCPFCGDDDIEHYADGGAFVIQCGGCGIAGGIGGNINEATARWNTRATSAKDKRIAELEDALQRMLDHYLRLVNSGDAGFWDPEKEGEVIAARKALTP